MTESAPATIYKYPLTPGRNELMLPHGFKILHVAEQTGVPCFWALVYPVNEKFKHIFHVVGTGWTMHDTFEYVGTAVGLPYVWHVFKEPWSPS